MSPPRNTDMTKKLEADDARRNGLNRDQVRNIRLPDFSVKRRGRPPLHPWHLWLKPGVHVLTMRNGKGVGDFDGPIEVFVEQVKRKLREMHIGVAVEMDSKRRTVTLTVPDDVNAEVMWP